MKTPAQRKAEIERTLREYLGESTRPEDFKSRRDVKEEADAFGHDDMREWLADLWSEHKKL